jgi:hypothetical protein
MAYNNKGGAKNALKYFNDQAAAKRKLQMGGSMIGGPGDDKKVYGSKKGATINSSRTGQPITVTDKRKVGKRKVRAKF